MSEYQVKRDFMIWNQIGFNAGSFSQMMDKLLALPTEPHAAYVCLVGVPLLTEAQRDPALARLLNEATLTVVDGMPIVKRARKLGLVCDRFSGPDFVRPFFQKCLADGKRHFFYGCTDDVLDKLATNLHREFPGIQICGTYAPPYRELSPEEDESIVEKIKRAKPDFLWIGLGGIKQERWMHDHRHKLSGCVMLGVGAAFNYLAGTLKEMPDWMEERSLGWLFRLCQEPRRLWRRYTVGSIRYFRNNMKYSYHAKTRDRLV